MADMRKRYSCRNSACPHSWHYTPGCPQMRASNNSRKNPPPQVAGSRIPQCPQPAVDDMYQHVVSRMETVPASGDGVAGGDTGLSDEETVEWWRLVEPPCRDGWGDEAYGEAVAYTEMLQEFIRMSNASTPAIRRILGDENLPARVKVLLSRSGKTPEGVLTVLSEECDTLTQANVGSNPQTPPEVLMRLAREGDRAVKLEVATNPSTPVKVLALLAAT